MFQILIADDEPNIREGVRQFITRRCPEWQVVGAARDGKEALAMAERFLPDCIMTDITMPHVNGLEFLEKIKEELPDAKLLILSGYDDFEYAVQGMRLGVSDYLLKPLDTELLIQRLDAFAAELTQRQQQWQDRVQQMQQRLHQEQKIRELMWRASAGELASEEMKELQQFCIGSDRYLVALFQGGPEIRQELPALLNQRFEKKLDAYLLSMFISVGSVALYPLYTLMSRLGLTKNMVGLALMLTGGQAANIFMISGFINGVPKDLDEAATIDGAGPFRIFWQIIVPAIKPILGVIALFAFRQAWNEFVTAQVFTMANPGLKTLSVAVANLRYSANAAAEWHIMTAGASIALLPILLVYLAANRQFIAGLTAGAVKG